MLKYVIDHCFAEFSKESADSITFLSRGGYFLKKAFDEYQKLFVPDICQMQTEYLYCSRKVFVRAKEDKNQYELLKEYLKDFIRDDRIFIVDEGWNCTSQQRLEELAGVRSFGCYIGCFPQSAYKCRRKGLLFHVDKSGAKSKHYGVLRRDCTLWEQLLTAPHGSVVGYRMDSGKVQPLFKPDNEEKMLYDGMIYDIQKHMMITFIALNTWVKDVNLHQVTVTNLKSGLFNSKKRIKSKIQLVSGHIDNLAGGETVLNDGVAFKIDLWKMLSNPQSYCRYFCRLEELWAKKKYPIAVYYVIAIIWYIYVRMSMWFY